MVRRLLLFGLSLIDYFFVLLNLLLIRILWLEPGKSFLVALRIFIFTHSAVSFATTRISKVILLNKIILYYHPGILAFF